MQKPASKFDIFKGNVKNPAEILFIYFLVFALIAGFGVYILLNSFEEIGPENTVFFQKSFIGFKYREDDLVLVPGKDMYFVIFDYERYVDNAEKLKQLCDGKTKLEIYARLSTPKNSDAYYHVCAIESGGEVFYSFADSESFWHAQNKTMLVIIGGTLLLTTVMFFISVYVGRNRHKFSQRTYDFFFRPNRRYRG